MPLYVNFNYYCTNDFHNDHAIVNCFSEKPFSLIHFNIRSISANFDNLTNMLSELSHPFITVIGLTETKLNISKQSFDNLHLPGNRFLSQPSLSNAGGTGIFILLKYDSHFDTDNFLNVMFSNHFQNYRS